MPLLSRQQAGLRGGAPRDDTKPFKLAGPLIDLIDN
jgi:hypothetical protein